MVAPRLRIVRAIVGESLVPVAMGLILGAAGALALTRFIQSLLFGVSGNDPWTVATAAALLLTTAGVASSFPARRAARIDPSETLRCD